MAPSIGPHEMRELELMKSGEKPLSMFMEPIPLDAKAFPEDEFDEMVNEGKLIKHVCIEALEVGSNQIRTRRVLYALPGEEWRISAAVLVHKVYRSLGGWRPDLDRVIGELLGYDAVDIDEFVERSKPSV
ncbi:hypothetical protein [Rhodopseudomonas sp. BR0G17]|uniref:hypothetical protein n=1 Tax=Rhodopseudomonas sp. BR0G17 TaxID=2269368 RepID=UPI0013E0D15C|nr:hypothetical protein [Rhodopseudomonas sp. BR0G17]NEW99367.1 hypothetical protein [Rhodopseudomonas sp. BR0G17]